MATQLSLNMGATSGTEKVVPYAEGDVLVKHNGMRLVVQRVERDAEAAEPEVLIGIALSNGAAVITFPREIAYRIR